MTQRTSGNQDHEYLGDGVYASHDGYHIWLDIRRQDQFTAIALEPQVFDRLVKYRDGLISKATGEKAEA